jgi:diguanylate cyclase
MALLDSVDGVSAGDILADMRRRDVMMTTEAFAVWSAYMRRQDKQLHRLLSIMVSNGANPDASTLHKLYGRYVGHLPSEPEIEALRQDLTRLLRWSAANGAPGGEGMALGGEVVDAAEVPALVNALAQTVLSMLTGLSHYVANSRALIKEMQAALREEHLHALTDTLTGLPNRRAFEAESKLQAAQAMNTGHPLAALLADIDHFKRVNDTYGHDVGDDVLRLVAAEIRGAIRGRDFAARFGGEEFVILLPDTDPMGAMSVADNIREAVHRCAVAFDDRPPLRVSISVGVSLYEVGENLKSWLVRADDALYRAKQSGRDCVRLAALVGG